MGAEDVYGIYGPFEHEMGKRDLQEIAGSVQPVQQGRAYESLICSYSWNCQTAYRIMMCESRADPRAYNSSTGMYGLMQISSIHSARVGGDLARLYDPETNMQVAHQLYLESGFTPWRSCLL